MFKLGSHDTMSYLKSRKWWMKPFHFIAKCQHYSIEEQFEKFNIRMFDIRLRYNAKESRWYFAHGCMEFKYDNIDNIFEYLNSHNEPVYVRMVLEYNSEPKQINMIVKLYQEKCEELRLKYQNLIFFEYRRKYDWVQLYSYPEMPNINMHQSVSSTTWKIYDDWCPWLYAKTHNKDIIAQGTNADWLFIDFIGKYY